MARFRRSFAYSLAAFALTLSGRSSVAAPLAVEVGAGKPVPAGATAESDAEVSVRRRLEMEDLERQDAARELERRGLRVKWQDVPLRVLLDWCDRIDAARALAAQHAIEIDWRNHTLAQLWDLRLRASKADELRNLFGVSIDWRRYSWADLEEMRRTLVRLRGSHLPADALVHHAGPGEGVTDWPQDPDSLLRPTFSARSARRASLRGRDTDDVLAPAFGFRYAQLRTGRTARRDPDGLMVPTFRGRAARSPRTSGDPDAVLGLSDL